MDAEAAEAAGNPCKIFVGNLPFSMTQNGLAHLFRADGRVIGAKLVEDRSTGKKKGFGFVTFESLEAADSAIARMQGGECEGRRLTVKRATARGEKLADGGEDEADEEDGFASVGRRRGARARDEASFRARAEARKREGKVLGWGAGDDDWA